jgi:hypothetical protein
VIDCGSILVLAFKTDCQMLLLSHSPTPLSNLLLQTNVKLQFDRTVTERSIAFFRFVSATNPIHFFAPPKCEFYFLVNTAQGLNAER